MTDPKPTSAVAAATPPPLTGHDLPVLEAYRALAAVMVVLTHVGFLSGVGLVGPWAGWLSRLDFGVALFFLLSGFLLFRPFVQAAYGRRPPVRTGSYLRRRVLRIYPAFLVVLGFNYLITPAARAAEPMLWLQTLLMLQNYTVNFVNVLPGLVQLWSLAVEVSFYLALPLLARFVLGAGTAARAASDRARAEVEYRRQLTPAQRRQAALARRKQSLPSRWLNARPWRAELPALRPGAMIAIMVAMSIGWRVYHLIDGSSLDNELLWLPAFLDWFGAGMALAWLRERDAPVPQILRDLAASPGACWSLALAGFWLSTTYLAGPFGLATPSTAEAMFKHLAFLIIAVLLLLPAVFGDPSAGWRSVAQHRFIFLLGRISFGLFLWHPMLIEAIRRLLRLEPLTGGFWITLVLTLICAAGAGWLSWRFIEEPVQRRWRDGFGRAHRPPTRASRPRFVLRRRTQA